MSTPTRLEGIILGGGRGERLSPLTNLRAKPAVQIGGKYRLIDVPISNCINSGIKQIHVLTQFNTTSLHRHIHRTYQFDIYSRGNIEILAAQQTIKNNNWFQGTADAVRSYWDRFENMNCSHFIILAGDHLYKMDYNAFFQAHLDSGSDISVAVKPMPVETAPQLGLLQTDANDQIIRFVEKPQDTELIAELTQEDQGGDRVLASMGIYIFSKEILREMLHMEGNDFGKNIIPQAVSRHKTSAYRFRGYWEDIGTIQTFFEANIALTHEEPAFSFYDKEHPTYTRQRFLPGSEIRGATIEHSIICEGCWLSKSSIRDSIVGIRSVISENVELDQVYFMGADLYEDAPPQGEIPLGIGSGSTLRRVIVDKNARIGKNVKLINERNVAFEEGDFYTIKDGIIVLSKNAVVPDNTVL